MAILKATKEVHSPTPTNVVWWNLADSLKINIHFLFYTLFYDYKMHHCLRAQNGDPIQKFRIGEVLVPLSRLYRYVEFTTMSTVPGTTSSTHTGTSASTAYGYSGAFQPRALLSLPFRSKVQYWVLQVLVPVVQNSYETEFPSVSRMTSNQ
jgi:hypothetical protein